MPVMQRGVLHGGGEESGEVCDRSCVLGGPLKLSFYTFWCAVNGASKVLAIMVYIVYGSQGITIQPDLARTPKRAAETVAKRLLVAWAASTDRPLSSRWNGAPKIYQNVRDSEARARARVLVSASTAYMPPPSPYRGPSRTILASCACVAVIFVFFGMSRWANSIAVANAAREHELAVHAKRSLSGTAVAIKEAVKKAQAAASKQAEKVDEALAKAAKHKGAVAAMAVAKKKDVLDTMHDDSMATVRITFNAAPWPAPKIVTLRLMPEFSEESVTFLREAAAAECPGELYRVEQAFLIQGRIGCVGRGVKTKVVKGKCPDGVPPDPKRQCPSHDPSCGCHGPIMRHGNVGWAGGSAGPDFFIVSGKGEMLHWAHDHTVFAHVEDEESWATIDAIEKLPVKRGGMTMLVTPLKISVHK